MEVQCPKCDRVFHSRYDRYRHLYPPDDRAAAHPRKKLATQYSEMTPDDWRAVAGWLDPKKNVLKGQVGSE